MKRESGASNTSEAMTVPSNTAHGAKYCDTSSLDYSLEKLRALVSSEMPPSDQHARQALDHLVVQATKT